MNPLAFLFQGLSSTSSFTSRPLLTGFGMALMGRYAAHAGVGVSTQLSFGNQLLNGLGSSNGLPWILSDTALLIFVVPGIAYYRLSLVASLKGYVPRTIGCLTRWGIRLAGLVLMLLQPIPIFGALMLPAMCLLNYLVYRKVIVNVGMSTLSPVAAPLASAGLGAVIAPPSLAVGPALGAGGQSATTTCSACGRTQPHLNFCSGCGARLG